MHSSPTRPWESSPRIGRRATILAPWRRHANASSTATFGHAGERHAQDRRIEREANYHERARIEVIVVGWESGAKPRRRKGRVCRCGRSSEPEAQYRTVQEVPTDQYDAALVCTPDNEG